MKVGIKQQMKLQTRMAQMKYLEENYCKEFNNQLSQIEKDIEEEKVDNLPVGKRFYNMNQVRNELISNWSDFPETWPWLHNKDN